MNFVKQQKDCGRQNIIYLLTEHVSRNIYLFQTKAICSAFNLPVKKKHSSTKKRSNVLLKENMYLPKQLYLGFERSLLIKHYFYFGCRACSRASFYWIRIYWSKYPWDTSKSKTISWKTNTSQSTIICHKKKMFLITFESTEQQRQEQKQEQQIWKSHQ